MELVAADPDGQPLALAQVEELFALPLNLRLGFNDSAGWPVVHPLWYLYDPTGPRLWVTLGRDSLKARRLREDGRAYFTVDQEGERIWGARGRVRATVREDRELAVRLTHQLLDRYLGTREGPMASVLLEAAESGETAVLELVPERVATWAY